MLPGVRIPDRLVESCTGWAAGEAWLSALPAVVERLRDRWDLGLAAPYEGEASVSWVAPARRRDGSTAVLKVGLPHMEAEHEIDGLRFWDGDPTVRLLDADPDANAMLLERCEPGTRLRELPEPEQDEVLAALLRRLWRRPPAGHPFRSLGEMIVDWSAGARANERSWRDPGLVNQGLLMWESLSRTGTPEDDVLLATDLHSGNVLAAQREPWLVIDPKPFVGDRAYDPTQHLFNCLERMQRDARGLVRRLADLTEVDEVRLRSWTFARAAVERRGGDEEAWAEVARALAP
jgi:streptomycin 6-kinase